MKQRAFLRTVSFAALVAFSILGGKPAPAYWVSSSGGFPLQWGASSPTTAWLNGSKTLLWSFNLVGFPQSGWPSIAQAGAAFQNAFQSLQEVAGTTVNFVRQTDTNNTPVSGDGKVQACFTASQNPDYFGMNITGEAAVTYVSFDAASGTILDADIELNGFPAGGTPIWSTTAPSPAGTLDVESVALHHAMTALGASSTPYFSAAAWPLLRSPGDALRERCLSPDDRMYLRTMAPGSPAFTTVSGTVTVQGSGAVCNRAIIVASDGDGVPQATTATASDGTYTLNIPSATNDPVPVTNISITAHHFLNGTYAPASSTDLAFNGTPAPTGFIAVQPPTGLDTRNNLAGTDFTVTAGTPTLTLEEQSLSPNPLGTQVLFIDPDPLGTTASGTFQFSFQNSGAMASVSNLSLGPGITLGTPTLTSTGSSSTLLSVSYSLSNPATPGPRSLSFSLPSGEQFFLPAVVVVVSKGGLTLAAGAQNPTGSNPVNGQPEVPLLQVTLSASASENLRVHQLAFALAGQGVVPSAVHLWSDQGSVPGFYDTGDAPIYSGNAYTQNPVGETFVPPGVPSTLTFGDLALTIPAGTTLTLLLTADMPASGTGSYSATFDPTVAGSLIVQGTSFGDAVTPTGSAVTGGTVTLGTPGVASLAQLRSDSSTIAIGDFTTETQFTAQGVVSSPSGQVGMEVEAKAVGVPFDGTSTQLVAATAPSGSTLAVVYTGLSSGTLYHWRARGFSSTGLFSPWVSFGGNPESSTDFSVDQSTVAAPNSLNQQAILTGVFLPAGGSAESGIRLIAQAGAESLGYPVQLQFEVRPSGVAFVNVPTASSIFIASGVQNIVVSGTSGTYHWQVRTVSLYGQVSAWMAFSGTTNDFTLTAPPTTSASGGCIATVGAPAPEPGRGWWGILLAAGLSGLLFLPRRLRKLGGTLGLLLLAGAFAEAAPESELPRTIGETSWESSWAPLEPDLPPPPEAELPRFLWQDAQKEEEPKHVPGPFAINLYGGAFFMDTSFKALGTDHVQHEISGNGQMLAGLDALYQVGDDWQIGLGAQGTFWSDVYTLGGGPVATWRFAHAAGTTSSGRYRWEHFLRGQVAYETFKVTKSGFGTFDATVGVVLGYEWRLNFIRHYGLTLGADVQYSQWTYSPKVLSGDTKVGGLGGFIYIGVTLFP